MVHKRILIIFVGLFIALMFLERSGSWLFDPDETRYAEISREMLVSGDYLTPRLNGQLYFEKPPLLYWLNAASAKLLGETPYAFRLPTRLAALGTVVLLIVGLGGTVGWWAALFYLSAPLPFVLARVNITDGLLSFSLTLAFFALRSFLKRKEAGASVIIAEIALGVGIGLAFMSKGLVGVLFPSIVFFVWLILHGQWGYTRELRLSPVAAVFLFIAAPWFILMERMHPGFFEFFFIHEHFRRFATASAKRPGPPYFFIGIFLAGFFPWLILFGRAIKPFFTINIRAWRERADESFFLFWFFSVLLFFSVSHSKLIPYILPAFPAACALAAMQIDRASLRGARWVLGVAGFFAIVYFSLIVAMPRIAAWRTDHDLAITASQSNADTVICYENFSNSFPLILHRTIAVTAYQGEIPSVGQRPKNVFIDSDVFFSRWNSSERMVALIGHGSLDHFKTRALKTFKLGSNHRSVLVSNFESTGQANPSTSLEAQR